MRKCGVCERGLRDGESPEAVRVGDEGANSGVVESLKVQGKQTVAPGLYSACGECVATLKPFIANRLTVERREQERISALVERRQQVPVADVTVEQLAANDLC